MKAIIYIFFIILCLVTATTGIAKDLTTAENYGFKGMPFGAPYEEVHREANSMMSKYNANSYGDKAMVFHASEEEGLIGLENYRYNLGNMHVNVVLQFDHNKKFMAFTYLTKPTSEQNFETQTLTDADNLKEIFILKYGAPSECFARPNILKIKQVIHYELCKWEKEDVEISTAVTQFYMDYRAIGMIKNKIMEKEYYNFLERKELKGASKGAKTF